MNTELNSLLSDFKNQLNIPEHELQSLRGFFNFLRNRDALAASVVDYWTENIDKID